MNVFIKRTTVQANVPYHKHKNLHLNTVADLVLYKLTTVKIFGYLFKMYVVGIEAIQSTA